MYNNIRAGVAANTEREQRSIILFHDSPNSGFMTWVLGNLIDDFLENPAGYTFAKIDSNVRPMQW
jgi:hypothetical protein